MWGGVGVGQVTAGDTDAELLPGPEGLGSQSGQHVAGRAAEDDIGLDAAPDGQGYTSIDGVKHSWKKGDVLNLPLRDEGIIVQHFNTSSSETAKFLAVEPNWFEATGVDRGCGFELMEEAPEHRAQKNG